jgi:putative membrane protein insertion efficiency factor
VKRSLTGVGEAFARVLRAIVLLPVVVYRKLISPALPARCKYYPTCSAYAEEAVRELGVVRGTVLAAWRLARCNPWSHGGVDELTDRTLFKRTETRSERRARRAASHGHGAAA